MSIMKNVYFTIGSAPMQVFAVSQVDEDQIRWLEMLEGCIPTAEILPEQPDVSNDLVHYGLFTYPEFRAFMGETGYLDVVSHTDTLYRHGQLAVI